VVSELLSDAKKVQDVEGLRRFAQKVREMQSRNLTEDAREVLKRILEATEKRQEKTRGYRSDSTTEHAQQQQLSEGTNVGLGVAGVSGFGVNSPSGGGGRAKNWRFGLSGTPISFNKNFADTFNNIISNTDRMTQYRGFERTEGKRESNENSNSTTQRTSYSKSTGNTVQDGLSYYAEHGSIREFMNAVSKTLQYAQKNLESYKQTLQATNSAELRTALLPKVFNQLKDEEAQKLQNSGLSKEEIEAKAAMNALARLDDMIEKSPQQLFKYLNSVSGLPDAKELKEKVEKNSPEEGTVGKTPPELENRIADAEKKLQGEYSLNAYVGNKRQADALAKKLTRLTGGQAEVIKMGKGYMVSVGGFHSEDIAKGLAQGLGLKNYQVVRVEPQQQQPQQQQPSATAKQ